MTAQGYEELIVAAALGAFGVILLAFPATSLPERFRRWKKWAVLLVAGGVLTSYNAYKDDLPRQKLAAFHEWISRLNQDAEAHNRELGVRLDDFRVAASKGEAGASELLLKAMLFEQNRAGEFSRELDSVKPPEKYQEIYAQWIDIWRLREKLSAAVADAIRAEDWDRVDSSLQEYLPKIESLTQKTAQAADAMRQSK